MEGQTRSSSHRSPPQHRRQRVRISFSCTNCRHGKQKCDRRTPCASCIRRRRQDTCRYEEAFFDSSFQAHLPRGQRPLRPADGGPLVEITPQNLQSRPPSLRDLDQFGYSDSNDHNALGIFKKLERIETGSNPSRQKKHDTETRLNPPALEKYLQLLRRLPSRPYVNSLVATFFSEVSWQYGFIDYSFFADELETFYESSHDRVANGRSARAELFSFPSLLFQIIALALQFMPSDYDRSLEDLCVEGSFESLAREYSDAGIAVSALFEKNMTNLVSVQATLLRVCWLKNCGRVTESWHVLGQAVMDAKEIGLDQEDGKVEVDSAENACSELWCIEMRRRVWLNLYLWDSEMGMVLGKSMNINLRDCSTSPPIDTYISRNRKITVPFPRAKFDKPTSFTQRLIEYRLQIHLPEVRELEAEGPYPRDYTKVQHLHQEALNYINTLPAIYRFENPDKSFDTDCPWLVPQREYLCAITWFFILALYKPYTFSIPESRVEIMRAGIEILKAQQRNFESLKVQHYKLFILTFLTFEAAVSILAVLIAYPAESAEVAVEAFRCIKQSLSRLRTIHENKNVLAGTAADVIKVLLNRADAVSTISRTGLENTSVELHPRSTPISDPTLHSMIGNTSTSHAGLHDSGAPSSFSNSNAPSLSNPQAGSMQDNFLPEGDYGVSSVGTESGYLFAPLQPMADLMYHELAPAFEVGSRSTTTQDLGPQINAQNLDTISEDELQEQFTGDFAENSFWSFMNQGL